MKGSLLKEGVFRPVPLSLLWEVQGSHEKEQAQRRFPAALSRRNLLSEVPDAS